MKYIKKYIQGAISQWLTRSSPAYRPDPFADFDALKASLLPGDVLLLEGNTRVARIIQVLTRSSWSHAALYVGKAALTHPDPVVRQHAEQYRDEAHQLLLEADIKTGVGLVPLSRYKTHPARICRPEGLNQGECMQLIERALYRLCEYYDTGQILDLVRYLLPLAQLPVRIAQALWTLGAGAGSRTICSTMIVEAFQAVHYPVLPEVKESCTDRALIYRVRSARLFVPADFDRSPFFRIIKHQGVDHPRYQNRPFKPESIHWA